MAPPTYQVTEPHPTSSAYLHCGRGGAGNYVKASKTASVAQPLTVLPQAKSSARFASGRGGAGNIHEASERALFSFDEELARQTTREKMLKQSGVYHVGRGGAGNFLPTVRPGSSSSGRKDSSSSHGSEGEERHSGFFGRLSHTFERR